jgi:hypothetical protein
MRKSRFTEEQIAYALRQAGGAQHAGGAVVPEDGRVRAEFLRLEEEVRGNGRSRTAKSEASNVQLEWSTELALKFTKRGHPPDPKS